MQALEEWNDKFGGQDLSKSTRKSAGFDFDFDTSYHVRVKSAKAAKSSKGDRQIQLQLAVLDSSEREVGKTMQWLTLPKQPETDLHHPAEQVYKWTLRRRDDLGKVLANVHREQFSLAPGGRQQEGDRYNYRDADGKPMSKAQLDARQVEINNNVMKWADQLHGEMMHNDAPELEELLGTEFYIVKVENKKNPKYPYTNIYANPSPKLPMFTGDEEAPF